MQRFTMILAAILSLLISMQVNADGNQGIIKAEVSFKLLESSSNLRINFNNVKIDNQNQNSIENLNALISFIGLRPITSILVSYQSPPKRFSFKAEEIYKSEEKHYFGKRFNKLSTQYKRILIKVCPLLADKEFISEALNTFVKETKDVKIGKFLSEKERLNEITRMGRFCSEEVKKVFVHDVQLHLEALGYNPGPIDGKFGSKTKKAISNYFSQNKLTWEGTISPDVFFNMRDSILGQKPLMFHGKPGFHQYFGENGKIEGKPASIQEKLANRKTINVFRPWQKKELGLERYKLAWTGWGKEYSENAITLRAIPYYAAYVKKNKKFKYPDIEQFITSKNYIEFQTQKGNWGENKVLAVTHPDFPNQYAKVVQSEVKKETADGVMFDIWHSNQERNSGYKLDELDKARHDIIKAVREKIGPNKIIMGNVNHYKDKATIEYLNGAFFELYKRSKSKELYTEAEYFMIESLLEYYQKNLKYPKLIALEGWRKGTLDKHKNGFNLRIAKLLTAMSVVIPENGYIAFSDNHKKDADTTHSFYDFYNFDIGKPVDKGQKLKSGIGVKKHENGFVAYNITRTDFSSSIYGVKVVIPRYSGLFCKGINKFDCLSVK